MTGVTVDPPRPGPPLTPPLLAVAAGAAASGDPGPLIARFRTARFHYVYDTNSNEVLRLSPVAYDLVPELGRLSAAAARDRWAPVHGAEAVAAAWDQLQAMRRDAGLLSSHRPRRMAFGLDRAGIRARLATRQEQLVLEATEACNLRCRYCIYSGAYPFRRGHGRRRMPWAIARAAIDGFARHATDTEQPTLSFYGGEPLLVLDLLRRATAHARGLLGARLRVALTTNGVRLDREAIGFLIEQDCTVLVSLDGPAPIHDRMRVLPDGRGSLATILANLAALRAADADFYRRKVGFAVTLSDPDRIDAVDAFFANEPLVQGHYLSVSHVDSVDTSLFDGDALPEPDLGPLRAYYAGIEECLVAGTPLAPLAYGLLGTRLRKFHQRRRGPLGDTVHANGICCPGARRLHCAVSGALGVCERANPGLVIGDARTGVDPERAADLVDQYVALSTADCTDCWAVRLCSLCFANAFRDRLDADKKRAVCEIMRAQLENTLRLYCSVRERAPDAFDRPAGQAALAPAAIELPD